MRRKELLKLVTGLGRPRILIVGDLILDRYVKGEVERISPEAPIPVLAARSTEVRLGGAGNVAANLRSMEAEVDVIGVMGDDGRGDDLLQLFQGIGADVDGSPRIADRPTTEKTRLLGDGTQMLRVDWEVTTPLDESVTSRLLDGLEERLDRVGAVVLSDYGKGVLTRPVIAAVVEGARRRGLPVLVDPKGNDYGRYRGATLATPNRKETEVALGRKISDLEDVPAAARDLTDVAGLEAIVITLGSDGIYYLRGDEEGRAPAVAQQVFDVTGAGDTVIAMLALGLASGVTLDGAVHLANRAAGIVVGRRGAATVTRPELTDSLRVNPYAGQGIVTRQELADVVAGWRAEKKRIVFTNGCFDILHAGHVTYLRQARARGDVLIVGVNDDDSVRRLKGKDRPINPLVDRVAVLAALETVDAVCPFSEDTPEEIIHEVTPDVLVKGEDWAGKGVVGREWVESHGGEVYLAPLVPDRSTTRIAGRLKGSGGQAG